MRHTILGAGGIGGLIGAVLAQHGERVTLVVRREALARQPLELSLDSKLGKFTVPVEVTAGANASDWQTDILWITVKATQLDSALNGLPVSEGIGHVVPLLNGVDHVHLLRKRFGHERVIPATIAVESERVAPGVIVHRSPFCRVNAAAPGSAVLQPAMGVFTRFGFECKFIENESTLLWSKLAFLAPLALSTTAAGVPIGGIRSSPALHAKLEACIREACAVANASGADLKPEPLIGVANGLPAAMKSSMQRDLEAENPLELDAIAGPILRGAAKYGIAVPVTAELAAVIQGKSKR